MLRIRGSAMSYNETLWLTTGHVFEVAGRDELVEFRGMILDIKGQGLRRLCTHCLLPTRWFGASGRWLIQFSKHTIRTSGKNNDPNKKDFSALHRFVLFPEYAGAG